MRKFGIKDEAGTFFFFFFLKTLSLTLIEKYLYVGLGTSGWHAHAKLERIIFGETKEKAKSRQNAGRLHIKEHRLINSTFAELEIEKFKTRQGGQQKVLAGELCRFLFERFRFDS